MPLHPQSVPLQSEKKDYKNYSNPDNDKRGAWTLGDLTVGMTKAQRPNQYFELINPITGDVYSPSQKRVWTFAPETMAMKIAENRVVFPTLKTGKPMMKRFLAELKSDIDPSPTFITKESYSIGLNSDLASTLEIVLMGIFVPIILR